MTARIFAKLRAGNVHRARVEAGAGTDPRYEEKGVRRYFRADADAKPDSMSTCSSGESSTQYGVPHIEYEPTLHWIRPVGTRPPERPVPHRRLLVSCRELGPRSACGWPRWSGIGENCSLGWASSSRHDGWPRRSSAILQWLRGTAEQWITELDSAVVPSVRGQPGASVSTSFWRTTLETSFAGCVCPRRSGTDRLRTCRSS